MNSLDTQYLALLARILNNGFKKENRTGVGTIGVAGATIEHDMSEGFPLLTCRPIAFKSMAVELEGFLKGVTDKAWYQERGCTIWDEWCNPQKVAYGHDPETQRRMLEEKDLGLIYGAQWRDFHDPHVRLGGGGVHSDQLARVLRLLKEDPNDRRMICSAWNPLALSHMALPPCHVMWQVTVLAGCLHLAWYQRSVDSVCGLPFNIASYGLLLHLLARWAGLLEGKLLGFLMDTHIYENHVEGAQELIMRGGAEDLPGIVTRQSQLDPREWVSTNTELLGYDPLRPQIKFQIAV